MQAYVYILSNCTNTVVYTGVTSNLAQRVYQHKHNMDPKSFTAKYQVHKLVYYEATNYMQAAIEREKQIKKWNRARKNKVITNMNPTWQDLYDTILG